MQSKVESLLEALANFFVGWAVYLLVFGIGIWLGLPLKMTTGLILSGVVSVVSVAKSYFIRRAFNRKLEVSTNVK